MYLKEKPTVYSVFVMPFFFLKDFYYLLSHILHVRLKIANEVATLLFDGPHKRFLIWKVQLFLYLFRHVINVRLSLTYERVKLSLERILGIGGGSRRWLRGLSIGQHRDGQHDRKRNDALHFFWHDARATIWLRVKQLESD